MELLIKKIENKENPKEDNSDKKPLFDKDRRPRRANVHKEEWEFIEDTRTRENIAYQMQYLEFLTFLYNDYQMYLTIESLHCKNMMAIIAGVIESALYSLVNQSSEKAGLVFEKDTPPVKLIQTAYDFKIINRDEKDGFHELRKLRNLIHLKGIEYQEHDAYVIDEVNEYLELLENFRLKNIQLK